MNNCLETMAGLSTALIFKRVPTAQLSKSVLMIVRAQLVRIALLSTALGALTGCDTVGGAMSSAGSSVGGFLSHRDPNAEGVNLGAVPDPKQVVVQHTARPSDRMKVLPVASQDINCPDVTVADGEEIKAHAKQRLAIYKVPREVVLTRDLLPRTASGKIDRGKFLKALRESA